MSDRVSANRPSTPTPAMSNSSASGGPADLPGLDQAAAEFASLLGADEQSRTETKTESKDAEPTKEGETPRTEHDRVERQPERGKDSQHGEGGGGSTDSGGGGDHQTETGAEPVVEMVALGDLILQGMTQKADVSGVAPPAETVATFDSAKLDNIVQQVADRILVSPPGAGGQEVRIMIKDSILPGTEVRITQHAGQLQISLVTDSARSHEMLTQHQAALQERLTEKLGKEAVVVNVKMDSQGQPDRDGRSRNQRDIEAELRENAE